MSRGWRFSRLKTLNDPRSDLKVHWLRSQHGPACKQPVTSNSTSRLHEVTCKKCLRIAQNAGKL